MGRNYDYLFKLLMIGDSGVGKTSIVLRYCDDMFISTYISTLGIDFKIKSIEMKGKKIKLQIWDTAGQEKFKAVTTCYYRGAMGIMLVYDITNLKSFENVINWLTIIKTHAKQDVEKIILGNKQDLEMRRVVSTREGMASAFEHEIRFMEVSAKSNININRAFNDLTEAILDKKLEEEFEIIESVHLRGYQEPKKYRCCFI